MVSKGRWGSQWGRRAGVVPRAQHSPSTPGVIKPFLSKASWVRWGGLDWKGRVLWGISPLPLLGPGLASIDRPGRARDHLLHQDVAPQLLVEEDWRG